MQRVRESACSGLQLISKTSYQKKLLIASFQDNPMSRVPENLAGKLRPDMPFDNLFTMEEIWEQERREQQRKDRFLDSRVFFPFLLDYIARRDEYIGKISELAINKRLPPSTVPSTITITGDKKIYHIHKTTSKN